MSKGTILKAKHVEGLDGGINYDSDEDILAHTIVANGKWIFKEGDRVIAEADAPAEKNRAILEQWAAAVRARTKRELNQDDIDKREKNRREHRRTHPDAIVDHNGNVLHSSPDIESAVESVPAAEVRAEAPSRDDDPDAWIQTKISGSEKRLKSIRLRAEELKEELAGIEEEYGDAEKDLAKWKRLKEAMDG